MQSEVFDVALVGGVFKTGVCLLEEVRARIQEAAPRANVVLPRHEPALGAALLALDLVHKPHMVG